MVDLIGQIEFEALVDVVKLCNWALNPLELKQVADSVLVWAFLVDTNLSTVFTFVLKNYEIALLAYETVHISSLIGGRSDPLNSLIALTLRKVLRYLRLRLAIDR